ncbi:MAG: CotH kinase family protein [Verrucomicrobia bacterium]|nr:CotH kinase family protein [Verrucomicrobiota bacterium]
MKRAISFGAIVVVASLALALPAHAQGIVLNEVMAANSRTLPDEDGDFPDWIELYNAGVEAVNLAGCGISDEAASPFKWVFGDVTLQPGEFLIVFASDKDRAGTALHTNFRINAVGEDLFLTDAGGTLLDYFPGRLLPQDYSVGRQPDGNGNWAYFQVPTPRAANTTEGFRGLVAEPVLSHVSGFHPAPFQLEIHVPDPEATIYYTTDGSVPTPLHLQGSTYQIKNLYPDGELITRTNFTHLYSSPIAIETPESTSADLSLISLDAFRHPVEPLVPGEPPFKGMVVRAVAVKPGFLPSQTISATYLIHSNLNARYSLSVVSIIADEKGLFDYEEGILAPGKPFSDWMTQNPEAELNWAVPANYHIRGREWERPAHFEFFEPDGTLAIRQTVGLRVQGNSSRSLPRKPLRVYARDEYGPEWLEHELFPGLRAHGKAAEIMDRFKRIHLRSESDQVWSTYFRDVFAQRLVAHLGFEVQAYRPVVHFLNGEYWGMLNMQEPYDEYYVAEHYGMDPAEVVILDGGWGPSVHVGLASDPLHYRELRDYATTNDLSIAEHYDYINTQMAVANFINYQVAHIYINATDWGEGGNNIRFWRKRTATFEPNAPAGHDGRWRWMMFDAMASFGAPAENTLARCLGDTSPLILFTRLLENAEFRYQVINAFADQMNTTFLPDWVNLVSETVYQELLPELREHNARWNGNIGPQSTAFAEQRPAFMRQHIAEVFNLSGTATVTLNVADSRQGKVQINSLLLDEHTVGIQGDPYPWSGTYFKDVPILIRALPAAGHRFSGWAGMEASEPELLVTLTEDLTLTALFEPDAHVLADGAYELARWDEFEPAGTYPPHMVFYQTSVADPGLSVEMDSVWRLPYNLTSRSRINGLGTEGFAFINTSNPQDVAGAGFVGAAVLALNTLGQDQVLATWTAGTVVPNSRVYGIRFQYRVGAEGPFLDVPDANGNPVQYVSNELAGHQEVIGPLLLPAAANQQPRVELRWKYFHISGNSGARAQLRVGNIQVTTSSPEAHRLVFAEVPAVAQAGQPMGRVIVQVRSAEGLLVASYEGSVEVGIADYPGLLTGSTFRQATAGVVVFDDLVVEKFGSKILTATAEGMLSAVSDPIAVVGLAEVIMPRYLQGAQPENLDRVPFAYRLRLDGLRPGATYRYANRVVTPEDSPTQDGAGNMIFVKTEGQPFVRTTESPRFRASDRDSRHGEFVTDSEGSYEGWFITEPSGNARFTPGNTVFMRLLLNDGDGGDEVHHILTAASPVEVLRFGAGDQEGSALYAVSSATSQNFVVLYADSEGLDRPVAATVVEASGATLDATYATFYVSEVAGRSGRWGTLLANQMPSGLRRIEERNLLTGDVVSVFGSSDGLRPTKNLHTGTTAVGIYVPGSEAAVYVVWQSRHFTLAELADETIAGPLADADEDGLPNLMKCALGLNLFQPCQECMPKAYLEESEGVNYLVFRYRRLIHNSGLDYVIENSADLQSWDDITSDLIEGEPPQPTGDGITTLITRLLPVENSPEQCFLRLRVSLNVLPLPETTHY